jgi:hypothetical protein
LIRSVLYSVPSPHCLCNAFVTTWALTPPHYLSLVPAPPNLLRFQLLADHWGNLNSTVHLFWKGRREEKLGFSPSVYELPLVAAHLVATSQWVCVGARALQVCFI